MPFEWVLGAVGGVVGEAFNLTGPVFGAQDRRARAIEILEANQPSAEELREMGAQDDREALEERGFVFDQPVEVQVREDDDLGPMPIPRTPGARGVGGAIARGLTGTVLNEGEMEELAGFRQVSRVPVSAYYCCGGKLYAV
jgi:hypothetical protein